MPHCGLSLAKGTDRETNMAEKYVGKFMTYRISGRNKLGLSEHQKQIRFLTGLSVGICTLLAILFCWLMNRSSFFLH
jgi:hypothetical protein